MSVTVVKDSGVTVITVASDKKSMLPPLCQILKTLCYSPICCSVRKGLMQTNVTAALGTIQIMVGLFNIGLGPGRTSLHPGDFAHLGVAYWLGGVFILAGIISLLAGRFTSLCLVVFAVLLNIIGSVFALTGIVLYAIDMADVYAANMCDWGWYNDRRNNDNCRSVEYFFRRLMTAMDITMIVLTVFQLCVCISFAVLGIKAVAKMKKEAGDVEDQQPQLKEVLLTSPGA